MHAANALLMHIRVPPFSSKSLKLCNIPVQKRGEGKGGISDGQMLRPLRVAHRRISTPWRRAIYTTVGAGLAGSVVIIASIPRGTDGLTSTAAAKVRRCVQSPGSALKVI